jgi:hypothetical protein
VKVYRTKTPVFDHLSEARLHRDSAEPPPAAPKSTHWPVFTQENSRRHIASPAGSLLSPRSLGLSRDE